MNGNDGVGLFDEGVIDGKTGKSFRKDTPGY